MLAPMKGVAGGPKEVGVALFKSATVRVEMTLLDEGEVWLEDLVREKLGEALGKEAGCIDRVYQRKWDCGEGWGVVTLNLPKEIWSLMPKLLNIKEQTGRFGRRSGRREGNYLLSTPALEQYYQQSKSRGPRR